MDVLGHEAVDVLGHPVSPWETRGEAGNPGILRVTLRVRARAAAGALLAVDVLGHAPARPFATLVFTRVRVLKRPGAGDSLT